MDLCWSTKNFFIFTQKIHAFCAHATMILWSSQEHVEEVYNGPAQEALKKLEAVEQDLQGGWGAGNEVTTNKPLLGNSPNGGGFSKGGPPTLKSRKHSVVFSSFFFRIYMQQRNICPESPRIPWDLYDRFFLMSWRMASEKKMKGPKSWPVGWSCVLGAMRARNFFFEFCNQHFVTSVFSRLWFMCQ